MRIILHQEIQMDARRRHAFNTIDRDCAGPAKPALTLKSCLSVEVAQGRALPPENSDDIPGEDSLGPQCESDRKLHEVVIAINQTMASTDAHLILSKWDTVSAKGLDERVKAIVVLVGHEEQLREHIARLPMTQRNVVNLVVLMHIHLIEIIHYL